MIAARYFCCAAASTRYAAKRESRNMSDINGSKPTNFPLDESKLDFKIPRTDAPRENVLKLGSMITNRIGLKATADDPEYWGLAGVMTDEMVDVALKMGVRKPKTTEQLMKLTKMEREPLEKLLTEMAWTGIIEYNWENMDGKNPKHEKRWVLPLFVPGSAEFLNMRKSQIDEHPEVAAFFERMTMLPLEKITPMVPPGGAGIGMHVIPVEKAIETENESVDLEHISYWLSKYEGKYAKSMCSCRASRAKLGEGCGDDAESWCIGVGDMADYIVETQRGEYITKDEALEIFKKPRTTALSTRSRISTVSRKFSASATATSMSATRCAHRSCSTRRTCRAAPMSRASRARAASPAAAASKTAPRARSSWDRSSARRTATSNIPVRSYPTMSSGGLKSGASTTATGTASTATIPVPRRAKRSAQRTSRCRAI